MASSLAVEDAAAPNLKRSKSDPAIQGSQVVKSAKGVKVDKNLDLEPLDYFMRIVKEDETSMSFFAQIPGFTYQYARYTDWIGQFLDAISEIDNKDAKALTKDQKSAFKALRNMYSRYEDFLQNGILLDQPAQSDGDNVQMIQTSQNHIPAPEIPLNYMILKAETETDTEFAVESSGLTLTASLLKCAYVVSKPNNSTNMAVNQSFLNRFGTNKPKNDKK